MTAAPINILTAMADKKLFGNQFSKKSWKPWRGFLATLYGLPLDDAGLELYRACTSRQEPPSRPFSEAWVPTGRRGGRAASSP